METFERLAATLPADSPFPDHLVLTLLLFAPLFGACVGSFLNVVVYRLPRKHLSLVTPGSHCFACGTPLPWYENLPVISWLMLGGKCAHCRTRVSPAYLVTELLTAALFAGIVWAFFWRKLGFVRFGQAPLWPLWQQAGALVVYLVFVSALLASSLIDIRHRIIPDEISVRGTLAAPLVVAGLPAVMPWLASPERVANPYLNGLLCSTVGVLVGFGTLLVIRVVGGWAFGKEAMGMGDVKLMGLIGGLLGWDAVFLTLFLSCLIGSALGILLWLVTRKHYLPFGPYLALAAVVVMVGRPQLLDLLDQLTHYRLLLHGP